MKKKTKTKREKERKPQEANIKLSYFDGNDNVEANLDWEIRVEQQLKKEVYIKILWLSLLSKERPRSRHLRGDTF